MGGRMPGASNIVWTDELIQAIRDDIASQQYSQREINAKYGLGKNSIKYKFRQLGIGYKRRVKHDPDSPNTIPKHTRNISLTCEETTRKLVRVLQNKYAYDPRIKISFDPVTFAITSNISEFYVKRSSPPALGRAMVRA
jgi:hypothetical protein